MPRPLLVNAAELLRRPGTQRDVSLELLPTDLALDDDRLLADAPIVVELRLESLTDGIVVDGTLALPWQGRCRRCLRPIAGDLELSVQELYQTHPTDADAFPIEGDQIDLENMVRESVLLDLPSAPLCSSACQGLCPVCGADRNDQPCACAEDVVDDRWAVLDELRAGLDDDPA